MGQSLPPLPLFLFFLLVLVLLFLLLHDHGGAMQSAASSIFMAEGLRATRSYGLMVGFLAAIGRAAGGLRCSGLCAIRAFLYA
jgi:hypothetical protein